MAKASNYSLEMPIEEYGSMVICAYIGDVLNRVYTEKGRDEAIRLMDEMLGNGNVQDWVHEKRMASLREQIKRGEKC